MLDTDWLSPNALLLIFSGMFIVFALVMGFLFSSQRKWIEARTGEPAPLWRTAFRQVSAILTHPDEIEMDALIRKANLQPDKMMSAADLERLTVMLAERALNPKTPENEKIAARVYLEIMQLALGEAADKTPLPEIQLVSTRKPPDQTKDDAEEQKEVKEQT